jgi:hypothetical protein
MNLLLHSMHEFRQLILTSLEMADARLVAEIGTEYGGMSSVLAEWLEPRAGKLWCIDPAPQPSFLEWLPTAVNVTHIARPSLEVLSDGPDDPREIPCPDAWLVDGDHNWYTVFHELDHILRSFFAAGKHPLIFLHDVGWPCARRDMYYAPDRIPAAFRKPYTYNAGTVPGQSELRPNRGFRGGDSFAYANQEGGPRNGVLTAVEDAIAAQHQAGHALAFANIPAVLGLGVVFGTQAPWSASLANYLHPYHQNALIDTLEKNRLANYLRVIEMQDTLLPG